MISSDTRLESSTSSSRELFIVREKTDLIEKLEANRFDVKKYIRELISDIAPLMITQTGLNSYVITFILHAERLFGHILNNDRVGIAAVQKKLQKMIVNVLRKDSLEVIRENKENLTRPLREDFWDDLTFEDVEFLVRRIAWLMRFFEPESGILVQIDKSDVIIRKEEFIKDIKEYPKLKEFIETNYLIQRIRSGAGLRSRELFELAGQLKELKTDFTIEYIQKYQDKDFIEFLWERIGMEKKGDPREIIEERFNEYIISKGHYNSRQLEFLELLKKIFSDRKYIEQSDFGRSPLSDEHPLDIFSYDELRNLVVEINEIAVC